MSIENFLFLSGCLIPAAVCAYTDVKDRLIYNKVVFPMLVFGLAYAVYASRLPDALPGAVSNLWGIFYNSHTVSSSAPIKE